MAAPKTTTLRVRLAPHSKESLGEAAAGEHRSLANMLEVMIRDYCRRNGVAVAAQWESRFSGPAG